MAPHILSFQHKLGGEGLGPGEAQQLHKPSWPPAGGERHLLGLLLVCVGMQVAGHCLTSGEEGERETGNRSSNPLGLYHSSALRQHSVCPQPAGEKAEPGKAEASAPVSQARRVGVCRVTRLRKPGVANAALPLVHSLT